jgi:uncharacterized protein
MKKICLLTLLALVLLAPLCLAAEVPPLRSFVNDYASMLSPQAVQQLEAELAQFEQSDSTQIVVLTIPSLEGDVLEQYSIKVVEAWKIGQKGKDNGALLLIVKNDRKIRIEVGRGLEGKLTDLVSGRIIRNEISPAFKQGDFDAGVVAGVHAIEATVRGEYQAGPRDLREGKRGANPIFTLLLFVGVAIIFLGGLSRILAGLAGAVGVPIAASLALGASGFFLIILGIGGFILGLVLSSMFSSGRRGGFFGGGPFFGGFGGGGFGGGGGGFSGGGGSFGGGGASGDW